MLMRLAEPKNIEKINHRVFLTIDLLEQVLFLLLLLSLDFHEDFLFYTYFLKIEIEENKKTQW